jgi:hypothetical protein
VTPRALRRVGGRLQIAKYYKIVMGQKMPIRNAHLHPKTCKCIFNKTNRL